MSFARKAKEELTRVESDICCYKEELRAMLLLNAGVEISSQGLVIEFSSLNVTIAKRFVYLVKKVYNSEVELFTKQQMKLTKKPFYVVRVLNSSEIVSENGLLLENHYFIKKECCAKAFIRGAFLASGSVSAPSSSYHFEFYSTNEMLLNYLRIIIEMFELYPKIIPRRKGFILYLKEAEKIEDMLTQMGAVDSMFEFSDYRISRDFRNSINRIMNCEIANDNKILKAANEQCENIDFLLKDKHVKISKGIKQAIELRQKFPEASLQELSEASEEVVGKQLSKSCLNHRFRSIKEKVAELKK